MPTWFPDMRSGAVHQLIKNDHLHSFTEQGNVQVVTGPDVGLKKS